MAGRPSDARYNAAPEPVSLAFGLAGAVPLRPVGRRKGRQDTGRLQSGVDDPASKNHNAGLRLSTPFNPAGL